MAGTTIRGEQIRDLTIVDDDISLTAGISETKLNLTYHTAGLSQTLWKAIENVETTVDHSLLQNLDYAVAGHTNFARTNGINTFSGIQTFSNGLSSTQLTTFIAGLISASPILFNGVPEYSGDRPIRNIVLTSSGGIPATTNGPAQTKIAGTNFEYYVLDYDSVTNETAYWNLCVPDNYADGSNLGIKVYWKESTVEDSTNVIWDIGFLTRGDNEVWDSTLTYTSLDASTTKNDNTKITVISGITFTNLGNGNQNKDLMIGIRRNASSDTYSYDARFLKAIITYDINK